MTANVLSLAKSDDAELIHLCCEIERAWQRLDYLLTRNDGRLEPAEAAEVELIEHARQIYAGKVAGLMPVSEEALRAAARAALASWERARDGGYVAHDIARLLALNVLQAVAGIEPRIVPTMPDWAQ